MGEPGPQDDRIATAMIGDHNIVRRCLIAWASLDGLKLVGRPNTVEDCLVHDVSWDGSLNFTAIALGNRDEAGGGRASRPRLAHPAQQRKPRSREA